MYYILIFLFILMPKEITSAAKGALILCIDSVVPALFPFMVAARCAILSGDIPENNFIFKKIAKLFNIPPGGVFSFIFGLICGYPVGAKTAFDLLRDGRISKKDAVHLACFTNNAGPAFVISVVGAGFFGSAKYGIIIYVSHILGSIITGIILRGKSKPVFLYYNKVKKSALSDTVPTAISDGGKGIINICGSVMFFSSVVKALSLFLPDFLKSPLPLGLITGFFEITSGLSILSEAALPPQRLLPLAAFIISFSGLSVIFQSESFKKGLNIKTTPCVLCKVLSAFISYGVCYFLTIAILFFARES